MVIVHGDRRTQISFKAIRFIAHIEFTVMSLKFVDGTFKKKPVPLTYSRLENLSPQLEGGNLQNSLQ